MNRIVAITLVAVALVSAAISFENQPIQAQARLYQLTVRNTTERQPISPPIVVVHENARLFPKSADRLDGLEEFAESGSQPALMESLSNRTGVKSVTRFGGIIAPQMQQTIINVSAEPGDHISVVGMLLCTNDAVTVGTAILTDESSPAFGSGVVLDAGTEENDESRRNVPCLEGTGASNLDTADGEGTITPHPGIAVVGDLGAVFGWDRTAMEFVVDSRGTQPKRAFEVGATLKNNTTGQPITSPVVVVHDKNVDVITYTRPIELNGIDRLSEGGDGTVLLETLAAEPGVVSVTQWQTGGPIAPGGSYSGNARAFIGTNITVLGMFACTNDGYIVASAEVKGSSIQVTNDSANATVFDSGAENNDETTDTVPCLGGEAAAFSEGNGENQRREHPGIEGNADLNPSIHGWSADNTATLSIHNRVEVAEPVATPDPAPTEMPGPEPSVEPTEDPETPGLGPDGLPITGGSTFGTLWTLAALILGLTSALAGVWLFRTASRRSAYRRQ